MPSGSQAGAVLLIEKLKKEQVCRLVVTRNALLVVYAVYRFFYFFKIYCSTTHTNSLNILALIGLT